MKATTIKDALANWSEKNKRPVGEAKYVGLQFQWLPIAKMDNNLAALKNCEYVQKNRTIHAYLIFSNLLIFNKITNGSIYYVYLNNYFFRKLSLSSNQIEKISGLSALKNLKILALGRNNISSFVGLEPLADTLEELWISYNNIEKMRGILNMRKLRVLYISHNRVDSWDEVQKLADMESLVEFDIQGKVILFL